jgi:dTDP-glucose pyrophosphorylase
VAEFSSDGRVLGIEEKPQQPKSRYGLTGIYRYDNAVVDIIDTLRSLHRGEVEIANINKGYTRAGTCSYTILEAWWTDTHLPISTPNLLQHLLSLVPVRSAPGLHGSKLAQNWSATSIALTQSTLALCYH